MDLDSDSEVGDHEEDSEDSDQENEGGDPSASVPSQGRDAYARTSLRLEKNDPELVELTIEDGEYWPSNAHEWQKAGESIAHNTHLKKLAFCSLTDSEEDATQEDTESLFRGVAENSSLQTLCFLFVPLRRELLHILVPFFTNNRNFENLSFKHCSYECTHSMASALSQFSSLKEFTLVDDRSSEGQLQPLQLQPIIDALSSHFALQELYLNNTHVGEGAFAALKILLQNTESKLISLTLIRVGINDQKAATLATCLTTNSTLRQLCLNFNPDITETGWMAIFTALCGKSCRIERLGVANNQISDAAAQSLAKFVTVSESLKNLNIVHSPQTTEVGWRAIFLALQSPACAMKTLFIHQNALDGAKAVLPAVLRRNNSTLERLTLSSTQMDDVAAVAIANALSGNHTLRDIILRGNGDNIAIHGWSAFSRALCNPLNIMSTFQSNHTLQTFVSGCPLRFLPIWENIQSLLRLNRENSHSEAARLKIIGTHFLGPKGFAVQPLVDMDLALLPRAIAWMRRDSADGGFDEHFYGFLRNTKTWLAGIDSRVNRKAKKQKTPR